jgi:hypothetical protein
MLRPLKTAIIVNFLLVLFFVSVNYGIWNEFSSHNNELGYTRMDSYAELALLAILHFNSVKPILHRKTFKKKHRQERRVVLEQRR